LNNSYHQKVLYRDGLVVLDWLDRLSLDRSLIQSWNSSVQ